jgi:hypothetical protein
MEDNKKIDLKTVKGILSTEVSMDDVFNLICETMTREQIFHLIKLLDEAECDWDFTEDLFNYFKAEMEKKVREV